MPKQDDYFLLACAILGMAPTIKDHTLSLDDGDPYYIESSENFPVLDQDFDNG